MKNISIRGLTKKYGQFNALAGIDLSVAQGELLALLGPSGCGKSTTLQLLAGFDQPTAGEIWIGDRLLSAPSNVVPPERRNISLVFQNYAVWPHKTVAQNVAYGLQVRRLSRSDIETRLKKALDTVQLGALRDRYPSELSGGQQQRVALARALVVEPDILLLDEPLSNLDAHLREEMRFEIRQVHDLLGLTTVYVTHDQSEALVTADKIAVLKNGKVQQLSSPEDVYECPSNSFVASFIGTNNELNGTLSDDGGLLFDNQLLHGTNRSGLVTGQRATLCIRPARVRIDAPEGPPSNHLKGTVARVAYLGEYRDVVVELANKSTLRAFVAPHVKVESGQSVDVYLPISECQMLGPEL